MDTNYVTRDHFGMYARTNDGPGPSLMGANNLLCEIAYALPSFGGVLGIGDDLVAVPSPPALVPWPNRPEPKRPGLCPGCH